MKRILSVLAVALVMVAMVAVMAAPAFATGNHFARGQNNTNPGFVNDSVGDFHNDGSSVASDPTDGQLPFKAKGERQGEPQGRGVAEN